MMKQVRGTGAICLLAAAFLNLGVFGPRALQAAPAKAAPARPAATGVAAEVNGDKIMNEEVESALEWMRNREPSLATNSAAAQSALATMRQSVLNNLINQRLLFQEAQRQKITVPPQEVEAVLTDTKQAVGISNDSEFKLFLTKVHKSEKEIRDSIVERLMVGQLTKKWMDAVVVTDADLKAYYEENKAGFVMPVTLQVRHILLSVRPDASPDDREKVRQRAVNVLNKAIANEDFAALAKAHSNDVTTRASGGKIGALAESEQDKDLKPLVKAAFLTPVGKVYSSLVQSSYGYHVVKVDAKNPSRPLSLDEVKDVMRVGLMEIKKRDKFDDEVKRLRTQAQIKIM